MTRRGRGNWQGRLLGPGQYTRSMLAAEVGVNVDTIRRWQNLGLLVPLNEEHRNFGGADFWVFDERSLRIAKRLVELASVNLDARVAVIQREFGDEEAPAGQQGSAA